MALVRWWLENLDRTHYEKHFPVGLAEKLPKNFISGQLGHPKDAELIARRPQEEMFPTLEQAFKLVFVVQLFYAFLI